MTPRVAALRARLIELGGDPDREMTAEEEEAIEQSWLDSMFPDDDGPDWADGYPEDLG